MAQLQSANYNEAKSLAKRRTLTDLRELYQVCKAYEGSGAKNTRILGKAIELKKKQFGLKTGFRRKR